MRKFTAKILNNQVSFYEGDQEKWLRFKKLWEGKRIEIAPLDTESTQFRRFFEGAVIPLCTFFQDNYDHRNNEDNNKVREWLKLEFCPEIALVNGIERKIGGTTKKKLGGQDKLVERIKDWLAENYGVDPDLLLNEKDYKKWRDTIFPFDMTGPDNYIDYLVSVHKLNKKI